MAFKMKGFSAFTKHHDKKRGYDTGGFEAKEDAMKKAMYKRVASEVHEANIKFNQSTDLRPTNKRRLKEVKSSIRDLRKERIKKIGNKRAQTNLKSAIAGLKEKKKQLKNK